ncbi:MAG: hypothetical protein ACD_33C00002G0014 [uncultured bacterium]|nr:MAG: hypothetical protein ACD_33C00002G0014 [uncultured bacterium]
MLEILFIFITVWFLVGCYVVTARYQLIQKVFITYSYSTVKLFIIVLCFMTIWPLVMYFSDDVILTKIKIRHNNNVKS